MNKILLTFLLLGFLIPGIGTAQEEAEAAEEVLLFQSQKSESRQKYIPSSTVIRYKLKDESGPFQRAMLHRILDSSVIVFPILKEKSRRDPGMVAIPDSTEIALSEFAVIKGRARGGVVDKVAGVSGLVFGVGMAIAGIPLLDLGVQKSNLTFYLIAGGLMLAGPLLFVFALMPLAGGGFKFDLRKWGLRVEKKTVKRVEGI